MEDWGRPLGALLLHRLVWRQVCLHCTVCSQAMDSTDVLSPQSSAACLIRWEADLSQCTETQVSFHLDCLQLSPCSPGLSLPSIEGHMGPCDLSLGQT
ncbi:hypothetical protein UPYG_G00133390 [Umbra pygmaea]|uniref:Secreted protein n=1 Tax=Umbra pygmaea TaxID=75934 RepID=A0ABD0WTL7_UMBPY